MLSGEKGEVCECYLRREEGCECYLRREEGCEC